LILPRDRQPSADTRLLAQKQSLGSEVRPVQYEVFVVEIFPQPRLIPKHLTGGNCERLDAVKE